MEVQRVEGFGWGAEAEAFSWSIVVACDDVVELAARQVVEVCFARQVSAESADGVLDTALLPWGARIAEVGVEAELTGDALVPVELGTVVEGDRSAQFGGHGGEHPDKGSGDGIGFQAVLLHGDGEPGVSFVCDENGLSGGREEHGIGFPMAWLLSGGDAVGAIVD